MHGDILVASLLLWRDAEERMSLNFGYAADLLWIPSRDRGAKDLPT